MLQNSYGKQAKLASFAYFPLQFLELVWLLLGCFWVPCRPCRYPFGDLWVLVFGVCLGLCCPLLCFGGLGLAF